ncbi:MAG TPA: DUF433 domain-containing protein [Phycisphaerales bacterium]|nr:DUF433 domain-containing protein [Phycisphaerales bacterium]
MDRIDSSRTHATIPSLGVGIYSIGEASRLTGVSHRRVSGWVRGYSTIGRAETSPLVGSDLARSDRTVELSFADLLEVRFVSTLRDRGLSMTRIRRASERAAEILQCRHPFITHEFLTDGRTLFLEVAGELGDADLVDLAESQQVFRTLVRPHLEGVEFDGGNPRRWWPLGKARRVVIDPDRSFGRPITRDSGVPTQVIACFAERFGDARAASWYGAPAAEVRDAVKFERSLAA